MAIELPAPIEQDIKLGDGRLLRVIRDDLLPGGTKVRILARSMQAGKTYVYASPAEGYAQIALSRAAQLTGAKAVVFVASRQTRHPNTAAAAGFGGEVVEVKPGYLTVVSARARQYCAETGAELVPFGMDTPAAVSALRDAARLIAPPKEAWCVAGSGVLARSLALAWPGAAIHAVQVGKPPSVGRARLYVAPERFEQAARLRPPFPSAENYDAKAWRFILEHAADDALFWNVGG